MRNIIFINSHPIQYFTPLYKYLNENGLLVEAWYGSAESLKGMQDEEFGVKVKWDIPLLEGYKAVFFKNHSWRPSHFNGFWGLINLGMVKRVWSIPKSVFIVHGWAYCTHVLVIIAAKLKGHKVCLRSEMPQNQELMKTGFKQKIKRGILGNGLFPLIDKFLYIGSQNKAFYQSYNIPAGKLIFTPYAVDNNRFQQAHILLKPEQHKLREKMGIALESPVIIYSGKYIHKKRPMDLLMSFARLNNPCAWLIMIGEGEERAAMEAFIRKNQVKNVLLTGFVNQSAIAEYYAVGDVFVMCSSLGETWGLSVNEALNFGMPVLVSDTTGCAVDLVCEGKNGYVFETGNIDDLVNKLKLVLGNYAADKPMISATSLNLVEKYSYYTILQSLKENIVK